MTEKDLDDIRRAVADYMWSEGCSCCRSDDHAEHAAALAKLLKVPKYKDGDCYDFDRFRAKNTPGAEGA